MNGRKFNFKALLPYTPLPVILLALALVKWGTLEPITLLMRMILTAFGYKAAMGDLRDKKVPNALVLAMLGIWVLVLVPQLFYQTQTALALGFNGGIGLLLAGGIFLVVYLVSRGGLGGGDVKFMGAAGLYLGFNGVLPAMLYGSVLAALTALILILTKKLGRKDTFPLVPFLYVGMLLTMFTQ